MSNLVENANNALTVERTPELIAAEINNIKNQTRKILLYNSIEIGRRLIEAKSLLEHGEWGNWLEQSVDYSQRTANNLMKIFEEYGADQITLLDTNLNSQTFANLSYSQAIALLKVPSEEREKFAEDNKIEELSTRELEKVIKEREDALRKLGETEDLIKEKEKEVEITKEQHEKTLEEYRNLESENNKQLQKVEELKTELEETKNQIKNAYSSGNNEEAGRLQKNLEELTIQLSESNTRVEELEKRLQERPIEVKAEIPEEIENELAELRKIKTDLEKEKDNNKQTVKFAIYFEELVNNFKSLLETLHGIEDVEEKEKYKGAVVGLISKMNESL